MLYTMHINESMVLCLSQLLISMLYINNPLLCDESTTMEYKPLNYNVVIGRGIDHGLSNMKDKKEFR